MAGTLPDGVPALSLGHEVVSWCDDWLIQPDGPDAGQRWVWTRSQVRFLLWLYAVDAHGRWRFRRAALRWAKGRGKSPALAAMALAELCGPVVFDHFGEPDEAHPDGVYGRVHPMPWVQLAATAESQTINTMSMVSAMAPRGSELARRHDLDVGKTLIYRAGGGRLEVITASARAVEGARPTFVVMDEVQEWTASNGGHALAETIRRNLAKTGGRSVEAGNAHVPGEDSVSERTLDAWRAQQEDRTRGGGVLYDALEAPAGTDLADEVALRAGLRVSYMDAPWVDLERIVGEVYDPSTPPDMARRYYLNQVTASSSSWLSAPEWGGCADPAKVVADGDTVVLGFDGSRSRARGVTDATALIGCRVSDGHVFELGVWEQPDGPAGRGWVVPVVEVDAAVRWAFERFRVVGFYADPAKWETQIAEWEARYGRRLDVKATREHPIEWWMTGGRSGLIVRALDQFYSAVLDHGMTHDGGYALTRHVLNARRRASRSGLQIGKEHPDSARKIDAAVAAVLAWQARLDAVAKGVGERRKQIIPARLR